jgi:hypothetical protein
MKIEYITAQQLSHSPTIDAPAVVCMPATDPKQAERSAKLMARRAGVDGLVLVVYDEERQGFIKTANHAFQHSTGDYFAYVAQDAFAGRFWLRVGINVMERLEKSMLAFNDGKWQGHLASFGLVRRCWAQAQYQGNLFCTEYHSHYGDAELTLIAKAQEQFCYAPRSVLIEVDWEKEDKLANDTDKTLFRQRAAQLFEGRVASPAESQIFPSAGAISKQATAAQMLSPMP